MRTREEQEAINKACKYHPETKEELKKLVSNGNTLLRNIDTSAITDMSELFKDSKRTDFSGIEKWDTSNVRNMSCMFAGCKRFNQPLDQWNISNVTYMYGMFKVCENFNQDLNDWSVREDCITFNMFKGAGQSYENVKEAFTEEQLLATKSKRIIQGMRDQKQEQTQAVEQEQTKGRGR